MKASEISTLLSWAEDGSRTLHYAFGVADDGGVLCLHKFHKGKAILHDLVKDNDDLDLRTRRFGTLATDSASSTLNFSTNKPFGGRELKALKDVLKSTRMKSYDIVFADPAADDDE